MSTSGTVRGRVIALDIGSVRTGLAISDRDAILARPLEVVPSGELEMRLRKLIREEKATEVVVGVPKTLGGETGFQARQVLDKLRSLRDAFPEVRFIEWDERMTTRIARDNRKTRRTSKRELLDHLAAAQMLQEYLRLGKFGESS